MAFPKEPRPASGGAPRSIPGHPGKPENPNQAPRVQFGRTPRINREVGRDHWGPAASLVFAGAGVTRGQVVGATDKMGGFAARRPGLLALAVRLALRGRRPRAGRPLLRQALPRDEPFARGSLSRYGLEGLGRGGGVLVGPVGADHRDGLGGRDVEPWRPIVIPRGGVEPLLDDLRPPRKPVATVTSTFARSTC